MPIATNIKSVDLTLFDILLFENPSPPIVLSLKIFLDLVSFRMDRGVYRYVKLPGRRQADLPKSVDREIIPSTGNNIKESRDQTWTNTITILVPE